MIPQDVSVPDTQQAEPGSREADNFVHEEGLVADMGTEAVPFSGLGSRKAGVGVRGSSSGRTGGHPAPSGAAKRCS